MRTKCQPAPQRGILKGWLGSWLLALAALAWAGAAAAAAYVDAGLPDVKPADRVVIAHPQPVQVLFEFDTKGAPNARGTKLLKQTALDTIRDSGLFSDISEGPTANGAVLSVVIDNVIDPDELRDAEGKGMVTGLTFFVAGTNVTDHYVCTIDYVSGPTARKIERMAHHGVTAQLGLINSTPDDSVKVGGLRDAQLVMVRQIIANPLNDLARDPDFLGPRAVLPFPPPPETGVSTASAAPPAPVMPALQTASRTLEPEPTRSFVVHP